jgi:hypothetical protein
LSTQHKLEIAEKFADLICVVDLNHVLLDSPARLRVRQAVTMVRY